MVTKKLAFIMIKMIGFYLMQIVPFLPIGYNMFLENTFKSMLYLQIPMVRHLFCTMCEFGAFALLPIFLVLFGSLYYLCSGFVCFWNRNICITHENIPTQKNIHYDSLGKSMIQSTKHFDSFEYTT